MTIQFKSAKNIKPRTKKQFGAREPLYEDISAAVEKLEFGKPGILVPLSLAKEKTAEKNKKRKKPLPEPTIESFKVNVLTALAKIRKDKDFKVEIAEDEENLIVSRIGGVK